MANNSVNTYFMRNALHVHQIGNISNWKLHNRKILSNKKLLSLKWLFSFKIKSFSSITYNFRWKPKTFLDTTKILTIFIYFSYLLETKDIHSRRQAIPWETLWSPTALQWWWFLPTIKILLFLFFYTKNDWKYETIDGYLVWISSGNK